MIDQKYPSKKTKGKVRFIFLIALIPAIFVTLINAQEYHLNSLLWFFISFAVSSLSWVMFRGMDIYKCLQCKKSTSFWGFNPFINFCSNCGMEKIKNLEMFTETASQIRLRAFWFFLVSSFTAIILFVNFYFGWIPPWLYSLSFPGFWGGFVMGMLMMSFIYDYECPQCKEYIFYKHWDFCYNCGFKLKSA